MMLESVLDYKKAFDLIDHSLLMIKLSDYDINPYIINWIGDFLSNRFQRVKLAGLFLGMAICTRRGSSGDKARPLAFYCYDR